MIGWKTSECKSFNSTAPADYCCNAWQRIFCFPLKIDAFSGLCCSNALYRFCKPATYSIRSTGNQYIRFTICSPPYISVSVIYYTLYLFTGTVNAFRQISPRFNVSSRSGSIFTWCTQFYIFAQSYRKKKNRYKMTHNQLPSCVDLKVVSALIKNPFKKVGANVENVRILN